MAADEGIQEIDTKPQSSQDAVAGRIPWAPFVAYGASWLILAAATVLLLSGTDTGATVVAQAEYPGVLIAALVLAIAGPLLAIVVWAITWYRATVARGGSLFSSALLRVAVALTIGIISWLAALMYVDATRLGGL